MTLSSRYSELKKEIFQTACEAGREPTSVELLAVSKGRTCDAIRSLFDLGQRDFAESYWQEAKNKIMQLPSEITWHFIGHLQRNKLKPIATHFDWVHSVYRLEEIVLLSHYRSCDQTPLQICIQVDIPGALGRQGAKEDRLWELILAVHQSKTLTIRGLMVMLDPHLNESQQYDAFVHVNRLLEGLNRRYDLQLDTLSMGMTHDFKAAIRAGSHWVRVGRRLFDQPSLD